MTVPGKVLVVCTGNVCRSPYLERRLRHELRGTGIDVGSAGTSALEGSDMDGGTREQLRRRGIDSDSFLARQLTPELLADADLVIAAAREHRAAAARLQPSTMARTVTLRDLADLLSEISAEEISTSTDEDSWVRQVAVAASRRRGAVPARQDGVDLLDPIGGPPGLFEQMAGDADAALLPVVRILRQAPTSAAC